MAAPVEHTPGATMSTKQTLLYRPLPWLARFYFYGMHGFMDELIFTSIFDFLQTGNWQLKGHSSIYSFFIYGSCTFFVEYLFVEMYYRLHLKLPLRLVVYVLCIYFWELTSGLILRRFSACPWDYSHYHFNFMGLITLEYAPFWTFLSIYQDVIYKYLLTLHINTEHLRIKDHANMFKTM
jgi:uncharacterized membrane protein